MKLSTIAVLIYVAHVCRAQFVVANSEKLFGEYSLSAAADARACPKKLVIRDLKPYVSIPKAFSLPVSHLVFDGIQCTTGNQQLELDFGGDNDGSDEKLPIGTCFDNKVAKTAWVVTPGKYPNGTFSFWDPNQPLVSRFEVNGECTHCTYSKPFAGKVKEGFFVHDTARCAGKNVYPPIKGLGEQPKRQAKYFINTKCEADGRLWARAGVVHTQRELVAKYSKLELRVRSVRDKTYSVVAEASCYELNSTYCVDWRRFPVEIVVPKSALKGDVFIAVFVNDKAVATRSFYVKDGCDRPDI